MKNRKFNIEKNGDDRILSREQRDSGFPPFGSIEYFTPKTMNEMGLIWAKKNPDVSRGFKKDWRRPTFPPFGSIIGAGGLNFSVRNGKR